MRRALAVVALCLFTLSASAAPRDDNDSLLSRVVKVLKTVVRRIVPCDDIYPPRG